MGLNIFKGLWDSTYCQITFQKSSTNLPSKQQWLRLLVSVAPWHLLDLPVRKKILFFTYLIINIIP